MTRRGIAVLLVGIALCPALLSAPRASAKPVVRRSTLQVFAAASLADAFTEIGRALERQRPGLSVRFNFAGSQTLAAQLAQGAAADVFASADERWVTFAAQNGLLSGEAVTFVRNRLVVIAPRSNPARIGRLQDLARGGVKLVIGADAVPVGHYSRTVLRSLSQDPAYPADFGSLALRNVVSEEENVKSVVGKVQLAEADAGIVYRSDVTPAVVRFLRVFEIPDSMNVVASYPIAIVKGTREPEAARAFVDFVLSADGQRILERNAFIPVTPAPH